MQSAITDFAAVVLLLHSIPSACISGVQAAMSAIISKKLPVAFLPLISLTRWALSGIVGRNWEQSQSLTVQQGCRIRGRGVVSKAFPRFCMIILPYLNQGAQIMLTIVLHSPPSFSEPPTALYYYIL